MIERAPGAPLGLVGVSLGGNVILKWLGERGADAPAEVAGAVAISTPFDLAACAGVLDRGLSRLLYTEHFLRTHEGQAPRQGGRHRRAASTCPRPCAPAPSRSTTAR